MFSKGYRPSGGSPHVSVVTFLRHYFARELGQLITEFDRIRKKRHVSVYDTAGTISRIEMEHALKVAAEFYEKVRVILRILPL